MVKDGDCVGQVVWARLPSAPHKVWPAEVLDPFRLPPGEEYHKQPLRKHGCGNKRQVFHDSESFCFLSKEVALPLQRLLFICPPSRKTIVMVVWPLILFYRC